MVPAFFFLLPVNIFLPDNFPLFILNSTHLLLSLYKRAEYKSVANCLSLVKHGLVLNSSDFEWGGEDLTFWGDIFMFIDKMKGIFVS